MNIICGGFCKNCRQIPILQYARYNLNGEPQNIHNKICIEPDIDKIDKYFSISSLIPVLNLIYQTVISR